MQECGYTLDSDAQVQGGGTDEATERAIDNPDLPALNRAQAASSVQRHNMAGFRAPKLDTVRVGVLGMGRGDNHIKALVQIEGVEIRAICDKNPMEIEKSMVWFKDTDHNPDDLHRRGRRVEEAMRAEGSRPDLSSAPRFRCTRRCRSTP